MQINTKKLFETLVSKSLLHSSIDVARVLEAKQASSTGKIETQAQFLAKRPERGFWRPNATSGKSFSTQIFFFN